MITKKTKKRIKQALAIVVGALVLREIIGILAVTQFDRNYQKSMREMETDRLRNLAAKKADGIEHSAHIALGDTTVDPGKEPMSPDSARAILMLDKAFQDPIERVIAEQMIDDGFDPDPRPLPRDDDGSLTIFSWGD